MTKVTIKKHMFNKHLYKNIKWGKIIKFKKI